MNLPPPVQCWPGVIILSGPALTDAKDALAIAIHHRMRRNLPHSTMQRLHAALNMADTSASGHPNDLGLEAFPTVPLKEAARRLGLSERQTRRLAPGLGGQRISGRWFIDELALQEHIGGRDG